MLQSRSIAGRSIFTFLRDGILLVALLAAVAAGPGRAEAYPSCGMLGAPACSGPMHLGNFWYFNGAGCGMSCMATAGNASFFAAANSIGIGLYPMSDNTLMYRNFDCGARGKCTIRGGDGLPVELMSFGVE